MLKFSDLIEETQNEQIVSPQGSIFGPSNRA